MIISSTNNNDDRAKVVSLILFYQTRFLPNSAGAKPQLGRNISVLFYILTFIIASFRLGIPESGLSNGVFHANIVFQGSPPPKLVFH